MSLQVLCCVVTKIGQIRIEGRESNAENDGGYSGDHKEGRAETHQNVAQCLNFVFALNVFELDYLATEKDVLQNCFESKEHNKAYMNIRDVLYS